MDLSFWKAGGSSMKTVQQLPLKQKISEGGNLNAFTLPAEERHLGAVAESTKGPLWKRFLDISCLLLAAPTVVPLMLFISCFIKLVSPGPIFFKQERIGLNGRKFLCLKFRSMKVNADTQVHQSHLKDLIRSNVPMTKMDAKGDKRLIPFGGLLRSSGLDELPQLINVLKGEMSLVGPRPCTPYEFEQYEGWHKERFRAVPGLTGLWQVSGKNKTTFNEMINLDIYYADHASIWLDLKIMLKTFPVLISQIQESRTRNTGVKS
jgi:lipopolysaccharide/colanic/teichoic acid biosynthesis glycosyltransferase